MPFCVQVHHLHVDFMSEKRVKAYVVSSVFFLVYDEKNNSNFLNTFMQIHVLNFLKTFWRKWRKHTSRGPSPKKWSSNMNVQGFFATIVANLVISKIIVSYYFLRHQMTVSKHGVLVFMSRLGVESVDDYKMTTTQWIHIFRRN